MYSMYVRGELESMGNGNSGILQLFSFPITFGMRTPNGGERIEKAL